MGKGGEVDIKEHLGSREKGDLSRFEQVLRGMTRRFVTLFPPVVITALVITISVAVNSIPFVVILIFLIIQPRIETGTATHGKPAPVTP